MPHQHTLTDKQLIQLNAEKNAAKLFLNLFETTCTTCSDYHLANFFRRLDRKIGDRLFDYQQFSKLLHIAIEQSASVYLRIGIFGSTDATLLEMVISVLQNAGIHDCEIAIFDRCNMPLILCDAMAQDLSQACSTIQADLNDVQDAVGFDIILMHGVVSFLPDPRKTLANAANNLRNAGQILISHAIGSTQADKVHGRRAEQAKQNLTELVSLLALQEQFNLPELFDRIDRGIEEGERRPNTLQTTQDLVLALEQVGLTVTTTEHLVDNAVHLNRRRKGRVLISAQLSKK